jgi:hypothetical protein
MISHCNVRNFIELYCGLFAQGKNCGGRETAVSRYWPVHAAEVRVAYAVTLRNNRCCKRRSLWIRAALVAAQHCGKYISAAVNQRATIEEAAFSVGPPRVI